jgi:hypothetical protein
MTYLLVLAGRAIATAIARVVPAIHALLLLRNRDKKDVDARHKAAQGRA